MIFVPIHIIPNVICGDPQGMPFEINDAVFNPPVLAGGGGGGGDWGSYAESQPYQQLQPGKQQDYDHQQVQHAQNQPPNSQYGKNGDVHPKVNSDDSKARGEKKGGQLEHDRMQGFES